MALSVRHMREHLALAELHIDAAVDRLALQEEAAARLLPDTADRDAAERLLSTMGQSYTLMLTRRAMIQIQERACQEAHARVRPDIRGAPAGAGRLGRGDRAG
jgi:hypothetical protein